MNYAIHYERLIERARSRSLVGYRERHHVIPKCMGGSDEKENIVELTGEEHYLAHQLLVKMYPKVRGLALAAMRMSKQCTGNKAYGWLRRRMAVDMSAMKCGKKQSPELIAKRADAVRGSKRSLETRRKMSIAQMGKTHSPLTRAKLSAIRATQARRPCSLETRAKIGAALRGRPQSPEVCAEKSARQRGKPLSAEHRANLSAALRGIKKSPEHVMKVAAANRGRKFLKITEEARA